MKFFTEIKYITIALVFACILFPSCRDDIYDPNSPESNINEPMVSNNGDSYTFTLNAQNITYYVVSQTQLTDTYSSIIIYVDKYKSGYASIFISDTLLSTSYSVKMDSSQTNVSTELTNYIPERVAIQFNDFTGKLNIIIKSVFHY